LSKTITIPAKAQLKQYHQELQQREWQEQKDKCILLSLAVAGLIGVYALVLNGVEQNILTEGEPLEIEQDVNHSMNRAAVNSLN
jgi:hypothetical protein